MAGSFVQYQRLACGGVGNAHIIAVAAASGSAAHTAGGYFDLLCYLYRRQCSGVQSVWHGLGVGDFPGVFFKMQNSGSAFHDLCGVSVDESIISDRWRIFIQFCYHCCSDKIRRMDKVGDAHFQRPGGDYW